MALRICKLLIYIISLVPQAGIEPARLRRGF